MLPALLAVAVTYAPASAQSVLEAGMFVGTAAPPTGANGMFGGSAAVAAGPLAARVSASVDAVGTPAAPLAAPSGETNSGAWTADADLGLRLPLQPSLLGLRAVPRVFAGLGLVGLPGAPAALQPLDRQVVGVYSYGATATVPLFSWLAIDAEARHRQPFDDDYAPAVAGWGYRVGLQLSLRTRGASRSRAAVRPAPSGRPIVYGGSRSSENAAAVADAAVQTGERYIGTPYRWGGDTPDEGFDCSGFVRWVYGMNGVDLPRVSRDQATAGDALPLDFSAFARGDLLFFASSGTRISHVAIYAGGGRILHSSSSGEGVRYDELSSYRGAWYRSHLVAARRVIGAGAPLAAARPAVREMSLDEAFDALKAESDDAPAPE